MQGDLLGREPIEITCQAWNRLLRLQCNRQEAAAAIKRAAAQFVSLLTSPSAASLVCSETGSI
jgi:hypothetical protein